MSVDDFRQFPYVPHRDRTVMMLTMIPLPPENERIQPGEIKAALNDSGYLLEGRIGHALEAK